MHYTYLTGSWRGYHLELHRYQSFHRYRYPDIHRYRYRYYRYHKLPILLPIPIPMPILLDDFLKFVINIIFHVLQLKKTIKGNYLLLNSSSYIVNNQFVVALNQTRVTYKLQGLPNLWQHNFILKLNIFNFML